MASPPRVNEAEILVPFIRPDGRRYLLACADAVAVPGDAVAVGFPAAWICGRLLKIGDRCLVLHEATSGAVVLVPRPLVDGVAKVQGARPIGP